MKDEIGNLIVNWANTLYTKLQYATQEFNMGVIVRRVIIRYKDVIFNIVEASGADITTGEFVNHMYIEVPHNIMNGDCLHVAWRSADSHTEAIDLRKRACYQLADEFVYKVLPKVDFWIRKEINNKEVEDILEVLD